MGSNGSVIPFFMSKRESGIIPITDTSMTRFNISLDGGVDMVLHALDSAWGGEIYIPKIPSYKILDIAEAIAPKCKIDVIGLRPGEKIHEEMITSSDSYNTYDLGKYYVILPSNPKWNIEDYLNTFKGSSVKKGFSYNSGENTEWETVDSLRDNIKEHLYSDFNF
jgi:FlaA1/EpsC-like NDP-sugar epimerase